MSFSTGTYIVVAAVLAIGLLWWGGWLVRTETKRSGDPSRLRTAKGSGNAVQSRRRTKTKSKTPTKMDSATRSDVKSPETAKMSAAVLAETTDLLADASETIGIADAETIVIADVDVVKPSEYKEKDV